MADGGTCPPSSPYLPHIGLMVMDYKVREVTLTITLEDQVPVDYLYSHVQDLDEVLKAEIHGEVLRIAAAAEVRDYKLRDRRRGHGAIGETICGTGTRSRITVTSVTETFPCVDGVPTYLSYSPQEIREHFNDSETVQAMTDAELLVVAVHALGSNYVYSAYNAGLRFAFEALYHFDPDNSELPYGQEEKPG